MEKTGQPESGAADVLCADAVGLGGIFGNGIFQNDLPSKRQRQRHGNKVKRLGFVKLF
ncbi:MAG: hypothetical protein HFF44_07855 [Lawsonibacter sp.]|nr:hypothetical protein [Lawsonibacter sp.]